MQVDAKLVDDLCKGVSVLLDPEDDGERGVIVNVCGNAAQPKKRKYKQKM